MKNKQKTTTVQDKKVEVALSLPDGHKREVIYVFQGGGALGSYQVGAFEALTEHHYHPDMMVGISIGAINAAIIAGNPPETRISKLHEFWNKTTLKIPIESFKSFGLSKISHWISANLTVLFGQPGHFTPRPINPWLIPDMPTDQISFYDTSPLKETLNELIDFDYLNEAHVRLCLGAVDLESGDFEFFDSKFQEIRLEHIMASGALPPGLPPVKIDGRYYVDGGVYSNTPLSKVIEEFADSKKHIHNVLCFMVDLFSGQGALPQSMDKLLERIKDIQYSSHTKRPSALYATTQNLSHAINFLVSKLTPEQLADPKVQEIMRLGFAHRLDLIHLVYHSDKISELHSKDYEFSTESANYHWSMGYSNTTKMIEAEEKEWLKRHNCGVTLYTLESGEAKSRKLYN